MRVGEEKHQDGGTHFHVVACFAERLQFRVATCFDIVGPGGVREHPNIRKFDKKQMIGRMCYASKDGKTTDFGVWKPHSLFPDSSNYLKKKADHDAWMHDSKASFSCMKSWSERRSFAGSGPERSVPVHHL